MAGGNVMDEADGAGLDLDGLRSRVAQRVTERRRRHLRAVRATGAGCALVVALSSWALTRTDGAGDPSGSLSTRRGTPTTSAAAAEPTTRPDDGDPADTTTTAPSPASTTTAGPSTSTEPDPSTETSTTAAPGPTPTTVAPPPAGTAPAPITTTTTPRVQDHRCQGPSGPRPALAYVEWADGWFLKNTGTTPITIEEPVLMVVLDLAEEPVTWGFWSDPERTTVIRPGETVRVTGDIGETTCRDVDGRDQQGGMVVRGTVDGAAFQAVIPYTGIGSARTPG